MIFLILFKHYFLTKPYHIMKKVIFIALLMISSFGLSAQFTNGLPDYVTNNTDCDFYLDIICNPDFCSGASAGYIIWINANSTRGISGGYYCKFRVCYGSANCPYCTNWLSFDPNVYLNCPDVDDVNSSTLDLPDCPAQTCCTDDWGNPLPPWWVGISVSAPNELTIGCW